MRLQPLMTLTAEIGTTQHIGDTGLGVRRIAPITGGTFTGERLNGVVLPGGADWILRDNAGFGRMDVRLILQTVDGAAIYLRYGGYLELSEQALDARRDGGSTRFGDLYFCTHLEFETGDERYRWLNHRVAAGEGRLLPDAVCYEIFEILPG